MKPSGLPKVLIAGAGLAGLACARELRSAGIDPQVIEREDRPGGLCRSVRSRGFTFDYTGHFLHFKNDATRRWVENLPGLSLKTRRRHAAIYSHGAYSEYPYQENNAGLPPKVARENVVGYLEAVMSARFHGRLPDPKGDFPTFCRRAFGEGVTRNFMAPYNAKLWKFPLNRLTAIWMGRFVPKSRVREVVEGARSKKASTAGYNATFLYPSSGGIEALPKALARGLKDIRLGLSLRSLCLGKRRAFLTDGGEVGYDDLVSSLPLPALCALTRDLPVRLRRLASRLKATSVYSLNFGLKTGNPVPYSWVYFPEPEFEFHRAGCLSSCIPESAPRGCSSLYVEVSYRGRRPDAGSLGKKVLGSLKRLGWVKNDGAVIVRQDLDLPGAYVVYDREREEAVPAILSYLEGRGVHSVGRWGRWEYGSMESALDQGRETGRRLI